MQWLVLTELEQECKSIFNAELRNVNGPVTVWGIKEAADKALEPLSCFDEIILCCLSISTFSKLATLIWDTPILSIYGNAVSSRKKVSILKDTIEFYKCANLPEGISELINSYIKRIESFGITIIKKNEWLTNITTPYSNNKLNTPVGKTVLTQEDIYLFKTKGEKRLYLETGSIVTPLARDSAKDLGIELIERN